MWFGWAQLSLVCYVSSAGHIDSVIKITAGQWINATHTNFILGTSQYDILIHFTSSMEQLLFRSSCVMFSSLWLEGLMLVVTLITIEVGCTAFSWPLDRDQIDVNNCRATDRGKLNAQSSSKGFARHLRGSWATAVSEGISDCSAAPSVELDNWRSSADSCPSGSGQHSWACS